MFYPESFVVKVKAVLAGLQMDQADKARALAALSKHEESLGDFLRELAKPRFSGQEIIRLLNNQQLHILYERAKRYAEYENLYEEWQVIKSSHEKTIIPSLFKDAPRFPKGNR